jgi:hypothetical protein
MDAKRNANDPAYKRLVLFPLSLFFMGLLVLSSWPAMLSPRGLAPLQLAANHALAQLAVLPSVGVFTGRTTDRTALVQTCFRISGYAPAAPGTQPDRVVLFDSFEHCRHPGRDISKPLVEQFHNKSLRAALSHLRQPDALLDRNRPPLDALFSLGDYYCHHSPRELSHVVITSRVIRQNLDTHDRTDVTTVEGAHHCREGAWETIHAQKPAEEGVDE